MFDRFLARVVAVMGDAATLKGGLVLELRLERARTTKDIDLLMVGSSDGILAKLQKATRRDLGDFMTFEVGPDEDHPEIQNDGMQYDGLRFRAECLSEASGPFWADGSSALLDVAKVRPGDSKKLRIVRETSFVRLAQARQCSPDG